MITAEITIKNYRCFPNPVKFEIGPEFTSFIGVNNSGKSTLLKFFYEFRNFFHTISNSSNSALIQGFRGNQVFRPQIGNEDPISIFCNQNEQAIEIAIRLKGLPKLNENGMRYIKHMSITITRPPPQIQWIIESIGDHEIEAKSSKMRSQAWANPNILIINGETRFDFNPMKEILNSFSKTLYIGPFRNALNEGSNQNYYDIEVGETFIQRWRSNQTGINKQSSESINQLVQDLKRIFRYDDLQINASEDLKTFRLLINHKAYNLSDVGSGLTQFILTLMNIAIKKPDYILIDEPELNLHPSLQLDFLTTLSSYAKKGIIFSTHVIGLARSVTENVYAVHFDSSGVPAITTLVPTENLTQLLGELNYSAYKAVGFEKILLVEGPTDLPVFQQLLRMVGKDHDVVILPLGGSGGIKKKATEQLEQVIRITPKTYAIIDSEKKSKEENLPKPRKDFIAKCKSLKINAHPLERRAIENYLTDSAIKRVKGNDYKALSHYQKLEDIDPHWGKSENWRIAREMEFKDIERTDLGQFIRDI